MSDHAAQVIREAAALRHVLDLAEVDRADAAAAMTPMALNAWLTPACRAIADTPAVGLPALWAILDRAALAREKADLAAAGVDLAKLQALEPTAARQAYAAVLAETKRAGATAAARTAAAFLAQVGDAPTEAERRGLLADAVHELTRAERNTEGTLAEAWDAHLKSKEAPEAGRLEVLRLDRKRGAWADWMNDWLGPRAGLEPGQTFILGGAPEAGKTSLSALLAVDALAADCPVLCWQLELSREEMLEHLLAQLPEPADWWRRPFWSRARRPLPTAWADLLTVPRWPNSNVEAILDAMQAQATRAERSARSGRTVHAVRGLVVVDYAQLLTVADAGPRNAQHEILATATSRLAKAAAEAGACLLLLSQMNKQDQRETEAAGTGLAGADLARMAHRVALLQKADAEGKACAAGATGKKEPLWMPGLGESRLLTWTKARGVRYTHEGRRPPKTHLLWDGGQSRALHDGGLAAEDKGGF